MARIRSIKPEFWTSAQVMECSPIARLLFVGMWNFADDAGRMAYSPKTVKAQIFPSDDISIDQIKKLIVELSSNGLILIYSADGKEFISITGWHHQKIDKARPSKLPGPFDDGSTTGPREVATDPILSDPKGYISRSVAEATRPCADDFEEFWKAFPRRDGPNPRKPAEQKFNALVKTGVEPAVMIAGAKQLASDEAKRGNIGTRFIPQSVTWLNQQRWSDHAAAVFAADEPPPGFYAKFGSEEQDAWDAYGKTKSGKPYPRDGKGGWWHPAQWPPGYVPLAQTQGPPPAPILKSM